MRRKVMITAEAAEAFRAARLWLTQPGSGTNGKRRWEALRDVGKRLRVNAYLGVAANELPGCRVFVVSAYRVVYQVNPDSGDGATAGDIRILALFGPGQR